MANINFYWICFALSIPFSYSPTLISCEVPSHGKEEATPDDEIDSNFVRAAIIEVLRESEISALTLAHRVAHDQFEVFETAAARFSNIKIPKPSELRKLVFESNTYYATHLTKEEQKLLLSTMEGRKALRTYVENTKSSLEASKYAWRILRNSVHHAMNEEGIDVTPLVIEAARLLATTTQDFFTLSQHVSPTDHSFVVRNMQAAKATLAALLSHGDFTHCTYNDESGLIESLIRMEGSSTWYLRSLMPLITHYLEDHDGEIFEIDAEEIEKLVDGKAQKLELSTTAQQRLLNTELFKILDLKAREQLKERLRFLDTYHIYHGPIESFVPVDDLAQQLRVFEFTHEPTTKKQKKQKASPRSRGQRQKPSPETTRKLDKTPCLATISRKEEPKLTCSWSTSSSSSSEIEESSENDAPFQLVSRKGARCRKAPSLNFGGYVDHRQIETTAHYAYTFDGDLFDNAELFMDLGNRVKRERAQELAHLFTWTRSYKSERAPNLASFFIRFHAKDINGKPFSRLFVSDDIYVSSASTFESGKEFLFKRKNNIKNAHGDFLTNSESAFYGTTASLRSLYLKNAMFNKLNRWVKGPWFHNALDSEALIALDLMNKKLTAYMSQLPEGSTIEGVVIGIKSLYKSCYRCGNLMQGFQREFHRLFTSAAHGFSLHVNDNARSIIIVDGEISPRQPVKTFMRTNNNVPTISSKDSDPQFQFRLLIKE